MRLHQHNDPTGMTRTEVGKALFVLGLSDRPLTQSEVYRIEKRALAKMKDALTAKSKGSKS